jgi:hypothetical protein
MIEKLFRTVEEAHSGMCIMLEYYHVIDYVVSIYKSPALIEENRPLIRTEGSLESAVSKAYFLLENYLYMDRDEQEKIESLESKIEKKEA